MSTSDFAGSSLGGASSSTGIAGASSSRGVSSNKGGGAGTPAAAASTASALAQLGARAEATASRPLVVSSAVDSSLQVVQAARASLQNMHEKDTLNLRLFSQSVQNVLEGKVS